MENGRIVRKDRGLCRLKKKKKKRERGEASVLSIRGGSQEFDRFSGIGTCLPRVVSKNYEPYGPD